MNPRSISDIITSLNEIEAACMQSQNRAGFFAALYKRMTVAVSNGITNGAFEDGARMEQLDIVFADRYLTAYEAFNKKQPCSGSWQYAFTCCADKKLTLIQHLLLGINTHINLDLAIAAATVAPGNKIHSLKTDFDHINTVIASLVDDVQRCLEKVWWPMRLLTRIMNNREKAVLNFSIDTARTVSWTNAVQLAGMAPQQQQVYIQQMDAMVHGIAQGIVNPGWGASMILKLVRFSEYDDVARIIHLIDTTVVE